MVAVITAGLAIPLLIALLLGAMQGGHQAGAAELTIQVLVLVGAFVLVAGQVARS